MSKILSIDADVIVFTKRADGKIFLASNIRPNGMALLLFYFFRLRHGQTQPMRNILSDMVATHCQYHCMPDIAIDINRQICCAAANIANCHAHLTFLLGQHHFC